MGPAHGVGVKMLLFCFLSPLIPNIYHSGLFCCLWFVIFSFVRFNSDWVSPAFFSSFCFSPPRRLANHCPGFLCHLDRRGWRYLMAAYSFIMSDESSKQAIATIDNEFYPIPTLKVNSSRDFFKIPQSSTRADWTAWSVSHSNNDALYSFKINKIGDNTFIYKHGWSHILYSSVLYSVHVQGVFFL